MVLGRQQSLSKAIGSAQDRRGQRVKPRHEQVLGVVALVLAVKAAHEPLDAISAAGQAQLLRPHLGVGGVVERRVKRVDVRRETDGAPRDAPGQGGRIANDQDVAVGIGGDRGQAHGSGVVFQVQVGEQELVGERLLALGEELTLAQRHRGPGGGKRVGQDVEGVDAVPAVHLHVLIDNPRSHTEALARDDAEGGPHAGALAAIDILVDSQVGLHRVHVARQAVAVARHPEGDLVSHWHVEAELGTTARGAAVDRAAAHLAKGAALAELGLIADVAHRAAE